MFSSGAAVGISVQNNVIDHFVPYDDDAPEDKRAGIFADPAVLLEDYNIFGDGWTWIPSRMGAHSVENLEPDFVQPSSSREEDLSVGDWRLADQVEVEGATFKPGISWELAGRVFGTAAYHFNL
jgi:hypothetical protein